MSEAEWWIHTALREYEATTGYDLRELRALIDSKLREVRSVQVFACDVVEKIVWEDNSWTLYHTSGTVLRFETMLCTEDSVAAFSLE